MTLGSELAREDEQALAFSGMPEHEADAPGFSLADDADGRFVIDRETGVISVFNDDLVARERHAIHGVRMRVVERDGGAYEFSLRLKITGSVPQTVGDSVFSETPAPQAAPPMAVAAEPAKRPFSARAWSLYAAAHAAPGLIREPAPRDFIALTPILPDQAPAAELMLDALAPAAFVSWSAA